MARPPSRATDSARPAAVCFQRFHAAADTAVNALLFGGVKNLSLATMAASSFVLNLISVLWIAEFLLHCYLNFYDYFTRHSDGIL